MRTTRNLIEELHRCSAIKDYEFINATLKLGQRMVRLFGDISTATAIDINICYREVVDHSVAGNTDKEAPLLEFFTWYINCVHNFTQYTAAFCDLRNF